MTEELFGIVKSLLGIWEHKEKTKYLDKVIKLEKIIYEENKKEFPDDFIINDAEFELQLVERGIRAEIERPKT